MNLLQEDRKYLHEYEQKFGHPVPASVLRSRLFGAGFAAKKWLDKNEPNPEWAARAKYVESAKGKGTQF
jgi:hypothetical protein